MKPCSICKKDFLPKRKNQSTCRDLLCVKEQNRVWKSKNKVIIIKSQQKCLYCQTVFIPFHKLQKTCGSRECVKANKNLSRRKEERQFECDICKTITWSSSSAAVLCGKPSCRKQYTQNFNQKFNFTKIIRKKVNKAATNYGTYSAVEITLIIKYKLLNKTNPFIALKLKRTLSYLSKKVVEVFNQDKYSFEIEEMKIYLDSIGLSATKKLDKASRIEKWNKEIKNYFFKK